MKYSINRIGDLGFDMVRLKAIRFIVTTMLVSPLFGQTTVQNQSYSSGPQVVVGDSASVSTSGSVVLSSGADVVFTAADHVTLSAGFHAAAGSSFHADLNPSLYGDFFDPSVPSSLQAVAVVNSSFVLSWEPSSDNVGVASYEVMLGSSSLGSVVENYKQVSGLTASTAYSLKVRAVDVAGNWSDWSVPLSVTTAEGVSPTVPTNLVSSYISGEGFYFSWSPSTDNVGVAIYEVRLEASPDPIDLGATELTGFFVSGLTASTAYQVSVRAGDAAGNWSGWSSGLSVTTVANTGADTNPANGIPDVLEASNAWNLSGSTEQASTAVELNVTEPTP